MATKTLKNQTAYVLRVSLTDIEPEIWRRLVVPSLITLKRLHLVIQQVMGWSNYHLHQFSTREGSFGVPDPEYPDGTNNEARVRLDRLFHERGDRLTYEYDFGDDWLHDVVLEKVIGPIEGEVTVECLDGAGACPPEDCGGPPGYLDLLHALRDRAHPRHRELLEWVGGAFDPERFDVKRVNRALAKLWRGA